MDEGHPLLRKGSNYQERGLEGYGEFFIDCGGDARVVFEATTHYLYQRTALEVLSELHTRPQIVFVLRKPSERVYSSFRYSQNNLSNVRRDVSFARFVGLVRDGAPAAALEEVAGASAFVLGNDLEYSRYVEYISLWLERFGRGRVHVLLFEDLKADPRAFMKSLARRVGISTSFYDAYDFPLKNETFGVRHPALHRGVRKLSELVPAGLRKGALKRVYLKAQSGGPEGNGRAPEDRRALEELEREFRPFNQRLADELGLDLSAWE